MVSFLKIFYNLAIINCNAIMQKYMEKWKWFIYYFALNISPLLHHSLDRLLYLDYFSNSIRYYFTFVNLWITKNHSMTWSYIAKTLMKQKCKFVSMSSPSITTSQRGLVQRLHKIFLKNNKTIIPQNMHGIAAINWVLFHFHNLPIINCNVTMQTLV